MTTKLYIGGLSLDTSDDSLRALFEQAGTVKSASVVKDRYSGRSRGFGFVEMDSNEEARKAIQELNAKVLDGRTITVAEAREPRQFRSGGGSTPRYGDSRSSGRRGRW